MREHSLLLKSVKTQEQLMLIDCACNFSIDRMQRLQY